VTSEEKSSVFLPTAFTAKVPILFCTKISFKIGNGNGVNVGSGVEDKVGTCVFVAIDVIVDSNVFVGMVTSVTC
jgi:hypothetical protein